MTGHMIDHLGHTSPRFPQSLTDVVSVFRTQRHNSSATFNARVAVEAIRGRRTVNEIAAGHQVHSNRVTSRVRSPLGHGSSMLHRNIKTTHFTVSK
jgi:hypothetical protein